MALTPAEIASALVARLRPKVPRSVDLRDLRQAAAVAAWQAERSYRPEIGVSLGRHVSLIVWRELIEELARQGWWGRHYHRQGARPPEWIDAPVRDEETLADLLPAPERVEAEALLRVEAERLLARLKPRHQAVMRERYLIGRTGPETAERLGLTLAVVRHLEREAMSRLRQIAGAG